MCSALWEASKNLPSASSVHNHLGMHINRSAYSENCVLAVHRPKHFYSYLGERKTVESCDTSDAQACVGLCCFVYKHQVKSA